MFAGIHLLAISADLFLTTLLIITLSLFLWNIVIFSPADSSQLANRVVHLFSLSLLFVGVIMGFVSLVIYYYFNSEWNPFVQTLPLRSLILFLFYIIILFYYDREKVKLLSKSEEEEKSESFEVQPLLMEKSKCETISRLTINHYGTIKVVSVTDILYLKANGDYVEVITREGSWLKEQTMKSLEETLPEDNFARIHRSFIVNISSIARIERYGDKKMIVLNNGERIRVSATGDKVLKEKLNL